MTDKFSYYEHALAKKLEQNHYKQLRCVVPLDEALYRSRDLPLVNFSSNDFLGLSEHPYVKKKTIQYVLKWGSGSSLDRLLPEHLQCQRQLEKKIASFLNFEQALLFSSEFQIHTHALPIIATPRSTIFIDKHCKNSLFQGAYQSKATIFRFDHNALDHLEELLQAHQQPQTVSKIIIVESLYHYDGDYADIEQLIFLSKKYNAFLYVDDSYTIGVEGKEGMGLCSHQKEIDFAIGTFGKSCGCYGAYLACNSLMKQYIINFGMLSTTIPPAVLGAIDAALDLIPDMDEQRETIYLLSQKIRELFASFKVPVISSQSHLICLDISSSASLEELMDFLSKHHVISALVKAPIHLQKKPRLRFIATALHSKKDIDKLHQILTIFTGQSSNSLSSCQI